MSASPPQPGSRPYRGRTDEPKTERITINLSEPLKQALEAEADREQRSMSFIVLRALRDYLKGARVSMSKGLARFNQEQASSDGGAILLKAAERIYGLVKAFAGCLFDKRAPDKTRHSLADLIGQRIFGIACGHPDCNDGDRLAEDPIHSCCSTETRFRASAWRRSRRCRGSRTQSTAARSTAWRTSWPRGSSRGIAAVWTGGRGASRSIWTRRTTRRTGRSSTRSSTATTTTGATCRCLAS